MGENRVLKVRKHANMFPAEKTAVFKDNEAESKDASLQQQYDKKLNLQQPTKPTLDIPHPSQPYDFPLSQIYDNHFTGAEIGAIIVVRPMPQGIVCGNTCDDGPCDLDT